MSDALVALGAAAIGATTGLLGALITARHQLKLNALKFIEERRSEDEKQKRLAVADLARALSRAIQAMSWFTWQAQHRPERVTPAQVDQYDAEMKVLLPDVMSAVSIVAALTERTFRAFDPLVTKAFELDGAIGVATSDVRGDPQRTAANIAPLLTSVNALFDEFRETLALVMGQEGNVAERL